MAESYPNLLAAAAEVVAAQTALNRLNHLRDLLERRLNAAVLGLHQAADPQFFVDTEAVFGDESSRLSLVKDAES